MAERGNINEYLAEETRKRREEQAAEKKRFLEAERARKASKGSGTFQQFQKNRTIGKPMPLQLEEKFRRRRERESR